MACKTKKIKKASSKDGTIVVQCNVKHSGRAQDLLIQFAAEKEAGLIAVTEAYNVPADRDEWLRSEIGDAALYCKGCPGFRAVAKGPHYVMGHWRGYLALACYLPPRLTITQFENELERMVIDMRRLQADHRGEHKLKGAADRLLIMGDLNAWSTTWGSKRTTPKGAAVEAWIATLGLTVVNKPGIATFESPQGSSIIDLTMCSSSIRREINEWTVHKDMETLSDHFYITFKIGTEETQEMRNYLFPTWRFVAARDSDRLNAAVLAMEWPVRDSSKREELMKDGLGCAAWLEETICHACDSVLGRRSKCLNKKATYWWNGGLEDMRTECNKLRRLLARKKAKGEKDEATATRYKEKKKTMRLSIRKAKRAAWEEAIHTLNADPWGRPYRRVMAQIKRNNGASITEELPLDEIEELILNLFPRGEQNGRAERRFLEIGGDRIDPDEPPPFPDASIEKDDLSAAIARMRGRGKAPGPDGITVAILGAMMPTLFDYLHSCLNWLIKRGRFPGRWKIARLALIPKTPNSATSGKQGYRPLCMLNVIGKIYQRILSTKMCAHLEDSGDLANCQYRFRKGRSTCDALKMFRTHTREVASTGGYVVAVSLDIRNAFGSIPWSEVHKAINNWGFPRYIQSVIGDFLYERWICFARPGGLVGRFKMECGVPQGSVLGPMLWNIAYDRVLRAPVPRGCEIVAYADDTLVVAGGKSIHEAGSEAEASVATVIENIMEIGLTLAVKKTEAILFKPQRRHRRRADGPQEEENELEIAVRGDVIKTRETIKYLGVQVDKRWTYREHGLYIAEKASRVVGALSRLMPNLRVPGRQARRLYLNVVQSILLYAIPVWVELFNGNRMHWRKIQEVHRRALQRVICGYRTVSYTAACLLAGVVPIDILAERYAVMYETVRTEDDPGRMVEKTKRAHADAIDRWRRRLTGEDVSAAAADRLPSATLREAFCAEADTLAKWVQCKHRKMDFRVTQVMTGHGSFGHFLRRIGKSIRDTCWCCDRRVPDTVQHTLMDCPSWNIQRGELAVRIRTREINISSLLTAMLESREGMIAVSNFCQNVMGEKEERQRQIERARRDDRNYDHHYCYWVYP